MILNACSSLRSTGLRNHETYSLGWRAGMKIKWDVTYETIYNILVLHMRQQWPREAKWFLQSNTANLGLKGGLLLPCAVFIPCPWLFHTIVFITRSLVAASLWLICKFHGSSCQKIFLWCPFSLSQLSSSHSLQSLPSLSFFALALYAIYGLITEGMYFLKSPCTMQYVVIYFG